MSGRGRLALCAAAATLAAACSLLPLVQSVGWLLQAAFLLAIVVGAGGLARRVPVARPLTVALQALLVLLLLTLAFAREQAVAGLVPGPDAITEFGQLLAEGSRDIGQYSIPAPVTSGIGLMLVGGVLVIGLLVDALAVTYRSAAPAGLPLLALYSVAAGLAQGGTRWLWFVPAAAGYLLLLLAEGRDRLAQWGRVFGGAAPPPSRLSAGLESGGGTVAPVRTGRRIGAVSLGIALLLPAALPSLGEGLLESQRRPQGAGSGSGGVTAVNPLVSLQNSLNQPENQEVLSYRTTEENTQDLYLRIVALDRFDGTSWNPSRRPVGPVPDQLPPPAGLEPSVKTTPFDLTVSASDAYRQGWLPMPYPATRVEIGGRWSFEPEGRTLVGDRGQTTQGVDYQVSSLRVEPTAEQLAAAGSPPADVVREYGGVPDSLPDVVAQTAVDVTDGAGNDYEKAVRLQDWFSSEGGFTYDTDVDAGTGSDAITRFLDQKEGFCVHFAFSMAAMARTLGIPARVAIGFAPGTPTAGGTVSVGLRDAHAWPELYFENVGWVRFEPTPTRGSVPDYALPETPSGGADDPAVPQPAETDLPSSEPSASDSCPPDLRRLGECEPPPAQAAGGSGDGGPPLGTVLLWVTAALVLLAVPLLPLLWRVRLRGRRLGAGPGRAADDTVGRILAAWRELIDSAWDYGILPDDAQTPRRAAARIVADGGLAGEAAEAAERVAAAVEQALYAPEPRPAPGIAEDVRRVRAGLDASADRWPRLRARLAPRSAVRVRWAVSRRRAALAAWAAQRWALAPRRPGRERG